MKNHNFILFVVTILCISTALMGCYTYFPVSNNDLSNINTDNKIKIILKNNREVILYNLNDINISNPDSFVVSQNDSMNISFSSTDIEKISEERFDFGKTFFGTFWISLATITAVIGTYILIFGPLKFS